MINRELFADRTPTAVRVFFVFFLNVYYCFVWVLIRMQISECTASEVFFLQRKNGLFQSARLHPTADEGLRCDQNKNGFWNHTAGLRGHF